jgi:glycosyltransferase involved in cell wall biosynthesis
MINILGLALYGPLAASHRVRLGQYCAGLMHEGVNLQVHSLLGDNYLQSRFDTGQYKFTPVIAGALQRLRLLLRSRRFDAAILYCEMFPFMPGWVECALLNLPYIYDYDDAFYMRYRNGRFSILTPFLGNKFDRVIKGAAAVTAGSGHLANYANSLNEDVTLLPSAVDTNHFRPHKASENSVFTVGWIGSPSNAKYLENLVVPLSRFGEKTAVRFVVVGAKAPIIPNVEVLEIPWAEDTEVELINNFDIGVMPLPDDEWARGKCAYKLVQYMACGVPVVASRVGANIDLVTPECGFLVESDEEWVYAMKSLCEQGILRRRMGVIARQRVVDAYSLSRNLPVLANVIRRVTRDK